MTNIDDSVERARENLKYIQGNKRYLETLEYFNEIVEIAMKYAKLKEFVRGKWKGDCSECAAIANEIINKEAKPPKQEE